jgi:hypothetical protein
LIVLAAPAFGLRFGFPDASNDQAETTTRRAYELVSRGFGPGANGPLLLAASLSSVNDERALAELAARVRSHPGVAFVSEPRTNAAGDAALLTVVPANSPQDAATTELVHRLRGDVLPPIEKQGVDVHVGGLTASVIDSNGRFSFARRCGLGTRFAGLSLSHSHSTARRMTCRGACVASKRCPSGTVDRQTYMSLAERSASLTWPSTNVAFPSSQRSLAIVTGSP